jgi:hypothetical protein
MAPKKNSVRKPAPGGSAAKATSRSASPSNRPQRRKHPVRKSPQPRVWRRVAKLAADALAALEAGNLAEVRSCLEAIRAVGLCAEES